jgi:Beta-propeller repeat
MKIMRNLYLELRTMSLPWRVAVLLLVVCSACTAQIQQAWVAHYNNGITNGTNQVVKMALDSSGNVYITGFSQNANSNLGYVTIKYAPNSSQLWSSRNDSTNYPTAIPAGIVLDSSNNVVVTGSAETIKYDSNGNQLWAAPYSGTALTVDAGANVYVTGFGTAFNTEKLNPMGSNVWSATYPSSYGPGGGQQVLIASDNSVYVAGYYTFLCQDSMCYQEVLVIKYGPNGNQLWTATYVSGDVFGVQVGGIALDNANNCCLVANCQPRSPYIILKYASNGSLVWMANNPTDNFNSQAYGLVLDHDGNVLVTGENVYYFPGCYGTYKLSTNGAYVWTNVFPSVVVNPSVATSIAVDSANNAYVTGYSPGTNSENDIVTIKYDHNGNQVWLQRYSSPGYGNAAGNAIAVDNNGNVYVAGYDTTTAGGTEMVLIKYSPVTIQRHADGTVLLEAEGSPGESFDIQASEDLLNWLDLGSVLADTNGLMQFDDTNAPNYPARFYYTSPQ